MKNEVKEKGVSQIHSILSKNQNKGQITIFIIAAIAIIAFGLLIYLFVPQIRTGLGVSTNNPVVFMQNCIKDKIEISVDLISSQGGSRNPEHHLLNNDEKIEYLCYTEDYYTPCVMQQPLLKEHMENEVLNEISPSANECFDSLKQNFESQGYSVNLVKGNTTIQIIPGKAEAIFNSDLTLTKAGNTERYDKIVVSVEKKTYELVSIANSILNLEARYGDSETTVYMNYYHDIKVEKNKQGDGSKIYIITDRNTGDRLQFATRSVAWPPGV